MTDSFTISHLDSFDDLSKVRKWKNMIVDVAGKSYVGFHIYNSQEDAEHKMQQILSMGKTLTNFTQDIPINNYAWHTQIPVNEP